MAEAVAGALIGFVAFLVLTFCCGCNPGARV